MLLRTPSPCRWHTTGASLIRPYDFLSKSRCLIFVLPVKNAYSISNRALQGNEVDTRMFEASGFKFGAKVSDNNHSSSDLVFTSPCGVVVTVSNGMHGGVGLSFCDRRLGRC